MGIQDFNLASLDGSNGFRLDGEHADDSSGISVSSAGDVNGDGFADLIIGASGSDSNGSDSGSSYVVFGKASGLDATMQLSELDGHNGFRLNGAAAYDHFGSSVSSAGDVNGDGLDDLIVGAPSFGFRSDYSSFNYVLFGRTSGFDAQIQLSSLDGSNGFRLEGESPRDYAGTVSSAGDVNGDGFADLIIGASGSDSNGSDSGSSYVVFGKASGLDATMQLSELDGHNGFRLNGAAAYDHFGSSVSGAGDINGDGFDDLIVGDPDAGPVGYDSGYGYVVFGKANGFDAQMDVSDLDGKNGFRLKGEENSNLLGISVSSAGDLNGDGFADLVIGVRHAGSNGESKGSSYVLFGKMGEFGAQIDLSNLDGHDGFRLDSEGSYDSFGWAASAAGDVNGDGLGDLIVSADGAGTYHELSGTSYVLFGRTSGFGDRMSVSNLDGRNGFRLNGEDLGDYAGSSVSGAGDVNSDGFDDLIVGAPSAPDRSNTGASYVIFGSADVTGNQTLTLIEGTTAVDHLQGTTNAEYLSAGAGDDTLAGGGGEDKFDGGDGDDVISVTDLGFAAIDGGAGEDTLQLSGSNIHLDLTQRADQLHHIETIDLQGDGDNDLTLTVDTLPTFHESFSTANSLTIKGNSGDRVSVLDTDWSDVGIVDGYHAYVNLQGTLRVQQDVQVDFVHDVRRIFDIASLDGTNGFRLNGKNIDDVVGNSISNAGDINGDGFGEVIVSAPGAHSGYVVFGKTGGFDVDIDLSSLDGNDGFRLEGDVNSVSNAGDFNGDGLGDVIIGAGDSSYMVFGKTTGFDAALDLSSLDGSNGFLLNGSGGSVSDAGDFNGDGLGDVIIGTGDSSYMVFGKTTGFDAAIDLSSLGGSDGFRLDSEHAGDFSGSSVNNAGDVNGDGFDDVIMGAPDADPHGDDSGSSYVVFGKASGFDAQMNLSNLNGISGFRLDGENGIDLSGMSVSSAGDINGDGFADVIVGAPGVDSSASSSGSAYVVFGKATGFDAQIDLSNLNGNNGFRLDGERETDALGVSVSSAGDFNGDGYDDLIIGTQHQNDFRYASLALSYVVFGKATGFDAQLDLTNLSLDEGVRLEGGYRSTFGSTVSGAGDINGDGLDDLIVGAPRSAIGSAYYTAGKSYVIFGSRDFGGGGSGELPEITGTGNADTLKGTTAAEHFIAGEGNDNLLGLGGADIFDAGAGNDAIRIGDLTFATIDGGEGNDALHLASSGMNLDLSVLGDQIHSIETICLYGRGDNTLTLTADSLLNLSDSTNMLKVHGDSGDHVVVQDSGWVDGGSQGFYHTYTHDDAVLLVGANVTVELV